MAGVVGTVGLDGTSGATVVAGLSVDSSSEEVSSSSSEDEGFSGGLAGSTGAGKGASSSCLLGLVGGGVGSFGGGSKKTQRVKRLSLTYRRSFGELVSRTENRRT